MPAIRCESNGRTDDYRVSRVCDFSGTILQFLQPWRNYCRGPQLGPVRSMAALVGLREAATWYVSCKSWAARSPSPINKQRRVHFISICGAL